MQRVLCLDRQRPEPDPESHNASFLEVTGDMQSQNASFPEVTDDLQSQITSFPEVIDKSREPGHFVPRSDPETWGPFY